MFKKIIDGQILIESIPKRPMFMTGVDRFYEYILIWIYGWILNLKTKEPKKY